MGILLGYRGYREYLIKKVVPQLDISPLGKRKIAYLKHKMRTEHLIVLMGVSGLGVLLLFLLTFFQFSGGNQVRKLTNETMQLKEELMVLKEEQSELMRMPLFAYPSDGFSFSFINWEQLLVENDSEERFAAEHELSYQLSPFLGRTMAFIFIDQPMQEISLTFMSTVRVKEDLRAWEENWQKFLEDIAPITLITQGTFSIQVSEEIDQSFEQTIVRDEEGEWQLLERRLMADPSKEESDDKKEVQSSEEPEKENQVEGEQKGSVKINE